MNNPGIAIATFEVSGKRSAPTSQSRATALAAATQLQIATDEQLPGLSFYLYWRDHQLTCLLYTSPSPRDRQKSRMPSSA